MKIASLVGLPVFAFIAGLASVSGAVPIENHGAYVSEAAKTKTDGDANHGSYVSAVAKSGVTGSSNYQGTSITASSTSTSSVQNVPEPGTVLLFAVGLIIFAVWHQHRSFRRA